jgi:hypothetical protein
MPNERLALADIELVAIDFIANRQEFRLARPGGRLVHRNSPIYTPFAPHTHSLIHSRTHQLAAQSEHA